MAEESDEQEKARISRALQERMERAREIYEDHGSVAHVLWVGAAVLVVGAGVVMLAVPGPGLLVISVGLAMLAIVFGGMRRWLLRSVEKGVDAKQRIEAASTGAKVLGILALAALVLAVAIPIVTYLWS